MEDASRQAHWDNVYTTKGESEVSWFQQSPAPSLELIAQAGVTHASAIIDIGGGASRLVDHLGVRADRVHWLVADVTIWQPVKPYDIWHDRAAFHFLTGEKDRAAYIERLSRGLKAGGHAIIATFALDGPEKCSGLPVARYDAARLGQTLGPGFRLVHTRGHEHATPWDSHQHFQFSVFQREG